MNLCSDLWVNVDESFPLLGRMVLVMYKNGVHVRCCIVIRFRDIVVRFRDTVIVTLLGSSSLEAYTQMPVPLLVVRSHRPISSLDLLIVASEWKGCMPHDDA